MPRSVFLLLALVTASVAQACPFCTAPGPTWAEQRDAARVVIYGEVAAEENRRAVSVLQVFKGAPLVGNRKSFSLPAASNLKTGALVIVFDEPPADATDAPATGNQTWPGAAWLSTIGVDERSAVYFLKAPELRRPAAEQLAYYLRYLEAPSPTVADDVYRQFGRASFNDVAQLADRLPMGSLRAWLVDASVPEDRRGFYAMALGLARDAATRAENEALLKRLIDAPASDFRAGFDGALAGYLLLTGQRGLDQLAARYVAADARAGDVFHLLTAVRFYREYGRDIPPARLAAAIAPLAERAQFAVPVITDLARWRAWEALPRVASWLAKDQPVEPDIERTSVAYLLACDNEEANRRLNAWRARDPQRAAKVEAAARQALGRNKPE
ncbi:MAG: hypothetical protein JSS27_16995 [Planctomycetes bacterium]|nr:hypothetical protein [Planctomycetota bacterium]